VLAHLQAHGSSTLRTTQLHFLSLLWLVDGLIFLCQNFSVVVLLTFIYRPFGLGVNLLMTEQMNQYQIAVAIVASTGSREPVMNLNFFTIEERFKAFKASALCLLTNFCL